MDKRRSRFVPGADLAGECLEARMVLSAAGAGGVAQVAAQAARGEPTQTALAVSAGTLGQPITFTATVRAPARAGAPIGTVEILDHGALVQAIPVSATGATYGHSAVSEGTATLVPQPGGTSYFFGRHRIQAEFVPAGSFSRSKAVKTFLVHQPSYTALNGGVNVASIAPGSGPQIQPGQTASVLYTGYLARSGKVFDESALHGNTPLQFTVGAGQVVPGFDAAVSGMRVGETRIVSIPPSQGYGSTANGPIPANSTLIFVVTLEAAS